MTTPHQNTYGSAIAAIWTPKRAVVASGPGNKIHSVEKVFFALAGLSACKDTGFDVLALTEQALQSQDSFKKQLENFTAELEGPLSQAAQFFHDNQPDYFKKHLAGRDALDAIFFTQRGDEVLLSRISFKTKKRGKEVVFQSRQTDYPNAGTNIMSVELMAVGAYPVTEEGFKKGTTGQQALVYPEQALQKFMDMTATAEPGLAVYPITITKLAAGAMTSTLIEKP